MQFNTPITGPFLNRLIPLNFADNTDQGAGSVNFGPPGVHDTMILTHFSCVFRGDSGGGALQLGFGSGTGPFFFSTSPTGGQFEWDHWDGFMVVPDHLPVAVYVASGHFDWVACGFIYPHMPGT